ncbi:MAG: response regulator [Candidatus Firestonebacteria bacterium]
MKKKKILLIDDEQDFTDLMKMRLEHGGAYEVVVLSSAKDILTHVREFVPDVILLDLLMPGLGGIEACQMLDRDPIGMNVPIIVLSGLDKEADKAKAYKCGVVDYIMKPVNWNVLIKSIEKSIKEKSDNNF